MRQWKTILFFARVIGFSVLVGALTTVLNGVGWVSPARLLTGAMTGAIIGLGCTAWEFAVMSNRSLRWLRALPIAVIALTRAMAYCAIIAIGLNAPALLILGEHLWRNEDFAVNFGLSFAIATAISMTVELLQLLGKEAALSMFTGRYRRPRLESRIVMFADLKGSTALAERLGELQFHALLADFAYDMERPIGDHRGEVHRYVGDAIITTWPMTEHKNFTRSLGCAQDMIQTLAANAETYTQRYGQPLRIRVALHCGPVAAGEIGAWKKEIALLGDTMNSAARIEAAARESGAEIVISGSLKGHLPAAIQHQLVPLPTYAAHGKDNALLLWALQPAQ